MRPLFMNSQLLVFYEHFIFGHMAASHRSGDLSKQSLLIFEKHAMEKHQTK
jgi:hypothetical protein